MKKRGAYTLRLYQSLYCRLLLHLRQPRENRLLGLKGVVDVEHGFFHGTEAVALPVYDMGAGLVALVGDAVAGKNLSRG